MKIRDFKSLFEKKYDGPDDDETKMPPAGKAKKNEPPKYEEEEEQEDVDNDDSLKDWETAVVDPKAESESEEEEEEDEGDENFEGKEEVEHLMYLIRQIFTNAGMEDVFVTNDEWDISIIVGLNEKEQLSNIIKPFETIKKIQKDIMAHYDASFELWESKEGAPLLVFNFEDKANASPSSPSGNYATVASSSNRSQPTLFPEEYHNKKRNRGRGNRNKNNGSGTGRGSDNNFPNYDPDERLPFFN